MCNCNNPNGSLIKFHSVRLDSRSSAFANSLSALASNSKSVETLFVSDGIDRIHTLNYSSGEQGNVSIKGNIGLLPFEGNVSISLKGGVISLTIELTSPFKIGPLTWEFNVAGDKLILAATPEPQGMTAMGLSVGCVIKCAGLAILPTLLACLPALAGGPPAYVACVTSKIGTADAAAIAACIAEKCV